MKSYTTIEKYASYEYEDKKSLFIGEAMPISSEEEAIRFIANIKKKYSDANHHVYAYVLRENNIMRYSDDKEPQGTAGLPVLDIIRKNGCTDAVIVVTRYFGGVLLGTGGLVRAYTTAASGAFSKAQIITYDLYTSFKIRISYSDFQKITPLFLEMCFKTDEVKYIESVEINGKIISSAKNSFLKKLNEITCARAEVVDLGEKFDF